MKNEELRRTVGERVRRAQEKYAEAAKAFLSGVVDAVVIDTAQAELDAAIAEQVATPEAT